MYLDFEFLRSETKRLEAAHGWAERNLTASRVGKPLEEVDLFAVPLAVRRRPRYAPYDGAFAYVGLAALRNDLQAPLVGIVPAFVKPPPEFALIRITSARLTAIFDAEPLGDYAVIIESWEELDPDSVYRGLASTAEIPKILDETVARGDRNLLVSLETPIASTPKTAASPGGIAFSTLNSDSAFSEELHRALQLIQPPEYRTFLKPPKKVLTGASFEAVPGFVFTFAERYRPGANIFHSATPSNGAQLLRELKAKDGHDGELSLLSTLHASTGTRWTELLHGFAATEVTYPGDLEKIQDNDIDLRTLRDQATEDTWIGVVDIRYRSPNPPSSDVLERHARAIERDVEALLDDESTLATAFRNTALAADMVRSTRRVALSLARLHERTSVEAHLKTARGVLVDYFQEMKENATVKHLRLQADERSRNSRVRIVETVLVRTPLIAREEIWQGVEASALFADPMDLYSLLEWLEDKGFVVVDGRKRYRWIELRR